MPPSHAPSQPAAARASHHHSHYASPSCCGIFAWACFWVFALRAADLWERIAAATRRPGTVWFATDNKTWTPPAVFAFMSLLLLISPLLVSLQNPQWIFRVVPYFLIIWIFSLLISLFFLSCISCSSLFVFIFYSSQCLYFLCSYLSSHVKCMIYLPISIFVLCCSVPFFSFTRLLHFSFVSVCIRTSRY